MLAPTLDSTSLMLIRQDCVGKNGLGGGTRAWNLLKQSPSKERSDESTTVVALVSQIPRMQLKPDEALHEYFIRAQELMTKLDDACERISGMIFMVLVLKGLPERFEKFKVQENFNPSANFTELRSRMTNFEDSCKQRNGEEEQQNQHVAMSSSGKFEKSSSNSRRFGF